MLDKYRDYFDIDPEYLAQINEAEIESHPDLWKKFYPHETFVKLVKDTISVISRKQKLSIWVEGAYGTGKSHAVLTLKKLLDASDEDTKAYFEKYNDELSTDLYNKFQQIKSGEQKILTVHRYGSSNIYGDDDLVFAIQQSIVAALKNAGIEDHGEGALKDSAVAWLSDSINKNYFNALINEKYKELFAGNDVDAIIEKLNTYSEQAMEQPSKGEALQTLMGKIMKVAGEQHFSALTLTTTSLLKWIEEVIKRNNFKAIVFIWDEFTDYFRNNMRAMTGFQEIADFSGDKPFYLMIVTHNVMHMFPESDKDWKRLMSRFVQPICNIELPENMAFRLMGDAMEENDDPVVQQDWQETRDELYDRTHDSRQLVKEKAKITDTELKKILPIHPYAALLLKHISSAFDSNQRSMFDFIKNDRGDEIKGFQWFINNRGPYDANPLLTIDMLWDFFYEKGKEYLASDIRAILDCYAFAANKNLDTERQRVLKTVLLLQAISQRAGDSVELFIPNERNLNNAFEGSDLENDEPVRIADSMVPDILYKKPMPGGRTQYSALINSGNVVEIDKQKEEQKKKPTSTLLQEADMQSAISLTGALRLRYVMKYVSYSDFKSTINQLRGQEDSLGNKLMAVTTFARDDAESVQIGKAIKEAIADGSYHIVFIDASITPLGNDLLEQYADAMANSVVNLKQDRGLAAQYDANAKEALKKWRGKIAAGEFIVYSQDKPDGERAATIDQLYEYLFTIDRKHYSEGLETDGSVNDTMWQSTSLPAGVQYGAEEITQGQFRSRNEQTKLENYIGKKAWKVPEYWKSAPYLPISKIKIEVDKVIQDAFTSGDRISIAQIYDFLQDKNGSYGFMPCNLTAFVIGFLLKEYTDGTYNYSDGTVNDVLNVTKLKEMVSEIIKHQVNPIPRYKDKYIVTTTAEEKAFNEASSKVFGIPINLCNSVEQTRKRIRQKMKDLSFPVWVLKYVLKDAELKSSKEAVSELIDYYSGIANNNNFGASKTDSDIAISIGKLCIENPEAIDDLSALVTKDKCSDGMKAYLNQYERGILPQLANEVGDGGQFINRLKKKFDADAANWVWNTDTANQKIDEVILEYKIVVQSNKILPKNISFDGAIREWTDKCGMIRISYLYAKNYWEDLSELMEMLYDIKKSGVLLDSRREKFLEQISANGEAFIRFYNNQTDLFRKACAYIVGRFSEEEAREIFKLLQNNLFTSEKSDYQAAVQAAVDKYISEQSATKLKEMWREKTQTENPRQWSKKYRTPILCMISDKDVATARSAFGTLNRKQPDTASIDKAIEFLERADFFDRLSSQDERDKAFRENVVKSYSVMLDDLDEVRNHLMKVMGSEPYDWFGLPEVDKKLKEMAEYKYNETGCDKALEKIDSMDVADVKQYLKRLIKDNMVVGMEIIKGK
ncbi:hypothetical protein HMP0721_2430 [Pseudoramibacter alactolyticus ATCC 23263]|uniref:Uncharacterized protein n=1 Tax=Pseudoramibacter alactolyticus ATCC 23263 TaxID=887929 RepID=E6MK94_9FIRM|nr:hypothetical protein [Pseudoramibacter alactolyticus]EFV00613.1 hypothetical protein HMP0721_2430 [Pseudoramibacter alactolyticus ATCC 23263]